IEHCRPVLGVVFAPALDRLYAGGEGVGAFVERDGVRSPIRCRECPEGGLTVVASRSHGDAAALRTFLANRKVALLSNAGSSLTTGETPSTRIPVPVAIFTAIVCVAASARQHRPTKANRGIDSAR